jgi:hypothetical protein
LKQFLENLKQIYTEYANLRWHDIPEYGSNAIPDMGIIVILFLPI